VFDRQASRLYDVLEQRQRLLLRTLLAVLVLCIAGLFFFRFESSMDDILPKDEVISRTLAFFRNSEVTGKVVISLGLTDPARGTDELFAAADRVAASLDRGLFPEVQTGLSEAAIVEDMDELLDRLPASSAG
jgi:predicted RND superfamily exporter protein